MLSERYDLICCGENYDCIPEGILTPEKYPNLCYFQTKKDWQEFLNRTPEEYSKWIHGNAAELVEFEVSYLMSISKTQRVIVDTNIPLEILREIADYNQVAVMISPQSMSVEHFFEREDPEKLFLKEQISMSADPQRTMKNFLSCLAEINSQENYEKCLNSGFFTIIRRDTETDTKSETLELLARHFNLSL